MGVAGLLPHLKTIQKHVTLKKYAGMTLGIDAYSWLHKAACSCAYELAMDKPTEKYLQYFIRKFNLMKKLNIKPYLIFDGDAILVKGEVESSRLNKRKTNKLMGEKLWRIGERKAATEFFQKSVNITTQMAKHIINYCRGNSIQYVVAPFEADSQMVYLEKTGQVQGIISEDSDLIVFGSKRLITKLNEFGECIEIASCDFGDLTGKFPFGELSMDQIRMLVCLSGCDYTVGIWKIGLVTAIKLVRQFDNMDDIVNHIKESGKYSLNCNFLQEYKYANYSFQYQRVFDPKENRIVTLNRIPTELKNDRKELGIVGQCIGNVISKKSGIKSIVVNDDDIDHNIHTMIANGDLDPHNWKETLISREEYLHSERSITLNNLTNPLSPISNFLPTNPILHPGLAYLDSSIHHTECLA